ncbi:MAG: DUF5711 family protein [Clostridiales bacterium]|nr:DUF5711 family protein [Clostridiales bacterium]
MGGENNLERQERKKILKTKFLSDLTVKEVEDLDDSIRQKRMRWIIRIAAVILIGVLLFTFYKAVMRNRQCKSYDVVWENSDIVSADASYEEFAGNLLKITGDGVSCLDMSGETLWNYGYHMMNPKVVIRDNYGAIADIQAQTAVIFGVDGVLSEVSTTLKILNLSVSAHGVLALELDDSSVNYITFYDNTGKELDIRIKTKLSGDGYPLDIALSPSGSGLATSVVYLDQSSMQNQLVFYNFDVGKSESRRMVGYFNFGNTMFPQIEYLSDKTVCAFGDDRICFYSLRNESQPSLVEELELESELYQVFSCEERVGFVCQGESGKKELRVCDTSGTVLFTQELDAEYTHMEFAGNNYVVAYNNTDCLILNERGRVRYNGTLEGNTQKLIMRGEDTCLMIGSSSMKKLRFK